MVERRKIEAMTAKRQKARRGFHLSSEEEENYESDIGDETDLDQVDNDKNPLQLWEKRTEGSYEQRLD